MSRVVARFLILLWLLPLNALSQPRTFLTFGIAPQQAATELAKRWTPILQYLTEQTGITLQFKTAKDLSTFQQEMKSGGFDIAFIDAYHYFSFNKSTGYQAFGIEKNAKFLTLVVTRKDSPITRLEDLARKPVAFASPTAVASMQAYTQLKNDNISITPVYVVSMDSVYRSVAKGIFPAGVGESRTLELMGPDIRKQLRMIWTAEPLPPYTFSAHPRVAKSDVEKIQRALIEMTENARGIALLRNVNLKGVVPANDQDFDPVRKLKLISDAPPM